MTKKEIKQLSYEIVGCAIEVHRILGPGLLESIYETCLEHELKQKGFTVHRQCDVPVNYKGIDFDEKLRFDLIVNNCIIIEVKAISELLGIHKAITMTYMQLTECPQGLIINFHSENITKTLIPLVNSIYEKLPE